MLLFIISDFCYIYFLNKHQIKIIFIIITIKNHSYAYLMIMIIIIKIKVLELIVALDILDNYIFLNYIFYCFKR